MQNRSAWAQPLATLPKYKENLQTWQPRAVKLKKKKEISEWSSGVESRVKPRVSDWLFRFVHVSPLFVCHPVPWPELKGHLGVQESFLNHVCECWYGSLDPAEGARGRFTPHDQERWRPFPRQPIFPSLCFPPTPLLRQCWRRSSLISPEPTGLFFHLRIPPSHRRGRSAFHIFCLFKSLAAFQSVHFLPPCRRAVSLSWPRLFMPSSRLQLWDEIFQSATSSRPLLPPLSPLVSAVPHRRKIAFGSLLLVFWFILFWTLWRYLSVCLSVQNPGQLESALMGLLSWRFGPSGAATKVMTTKRP